MRPGPRARREAGRFLRFSVVGTIGAVVDFGSFNLLHVRAGLHPVAASTLSFLLAVASNFVWNRYWTYPDSRSKPVTRQAGQFILISVVGLAIRVPVFTFSQLPMIRLAETLLSAVGPGAVSAEVLGRNLALAVAVVVVLLWNFGANRLWTYSDAA
jgi:putative flippase GtrA